MADLMLTADSPYMIVVDDNGEYWMFMAVRRCATCGEKRPAFLLPGDAYRCAVCGVIWDPSEASC